MPLSIIQLKWTIFKRSIKQIPFVYLFIIVSSLLALLYLLLKLDTNSTWHSISLIGVIYIFLFSRIEYTPEHRLLLKQYTNALYISVLIDALLISIPFYFINLLSGTTTSSLAIIMSFISVNHNNRAKINFVIPSPFFNKGSYMWHSNVRYLLPIVWLLTLLFIIIGKVHDNYNLSTVSFGIGAFISFISTIIQAEDQSFIQMHLDKKHFIKTNIKETIYNSMIFTIPLVSVMVMLFPYKWYISIITLLVLILLAIKLSITKYAFYSSITLSVVIFTIGVFIIGALAVSLYGIALIPIYFVALYYQYRKNVSKLLTENEKSDY